MTEHISKSLDRIINHQVPVEKKQHHLAHNFLGSRRFNTTGCRHLEAISAAHGGFRRRYPTLRYRRLALILPPVAADVLGEIRDDVMAMGFDAVRIEEEQPSFMITVEEI